MISLRERREKFRDLQIPTLAMVLAAIAAGVFYPDVGLYTTLVALWGVTWTLLEINADTRFHRTLSTREAFGTAPLLLVVLLAGATYCITVIF